MDQKRIGRFIAQLRKEAAMTQEELGSAIGVTNKTISRWENGNYMPDIVLMKELCDVFRLISMNCSVENGSAMRIFVRRQKKISYYHSTK